LVKIPLTDDGSEIPTFIKPGWGGVQVFYGDYYAIIIDGVVDYGSAKLQWEQMHTPVRPGYWVKTVVPTAYRAQEVCRIVTLIPDKNGDIKEANYVLQPGEWIVQQPGGEVQHIKAAKFGGIYFSQEEAEVLGLTGMTLDEFSTWAVAQAHQTAQV
jgi:hypothetical protein